MKKPIPFGKYLLLERVNVGGMAEVFKAKAFGVEGFERLVAVKRILPSIAEDQEFITMFIDEAKIAVQLSHTNIAQIFDLGKVHDSYFIAMEYVAGKDLRAIFDRARKKGETVPVPMACYAVMKICEGLDYAHNKKSASGQDLHLVHRDVSPQNIIVSYDGEVKLIDFGIAKAANKAGKTQAGILKGKFGYMSPEQVRGLPLDRRSDVFSVGTVLYELLTGERLFLGESDFSTLEKIRNVDILPPTSYNRRIPEELEHIILKALAKDADERYQTTMDLHDDLQSFMYTSGNFFARKDLSAYMHKVFGEEIAKEIARDEEYQKIDASAAAVSTSQPPPPPIPMAANVSRAPKSTMLGMGGLPSAVRTTTPGGAVAPPPPASAAHGGIPGTPRAGGPMEWDDEELATQIYDKDVDAPPPGYPPIAAVPSAPINPYITEPGLRGAPMPSGRPIPMPAPRAGVPAAVPSPAPRHADRTDPGARVIEEPRGPSLALLGAAAIAVLAVVGAAWFVLKPEELGTVHFSTTPGDAQVVFDEAPLASGTSPFVISDVAPNTVHLLEVRKEGYRTWTTRIEIRPGQLLVLPNVTLEADGDSPAAPTAGTGVTVTSEPEAATVYIDGRILPKSTPVTVNDLTSGPHTIRIEMPGHAPWERSVEVEANRILELPLARLNPARVMVHFESEPSGADVIAVRGPVERVIGRTPAVAEIELTRGDWTVKMLMRGYQDWTGPLEVNGQTEVTLRATLVAGSGRRTEAAPAPAAETTAAAAAPAPAAEPRLSARQRRALEAAARRRALAEAAAARRAAAATSSSTSTGSRTPSSSETASRPAGNANAPGTLRINTRPWSQVYVDGQLIGNTPQMNISLTPGSHQVTLVNPDFNVRQSINVNIQGGETTTRVLTLEQGN